MVVGLMGVCWMFGYEDCLFWYSGKLALTQARGGLQSGIWSGFGINVFDVQI